MAGLTVESAPHSEQLDSTITGTADLENLKAFLGALPVRAAAWNKAAEFWPLVGKRVKDFLVGQSASDPNAFDGILSALLQERKWTGAAAEEFKAKAEAVRSFGLSVVANATQMVDAAARSQLPQSMQYELTNGNTFEKTAGFVGLIMQEQADDFSRATTDWNNWIINIADLIANLKSTQRFKVPVAIPTFEEFHGNPDSTNFGRACYGSAYISLDDDGPFASTVHYSGRSGPLSNKQIYWTAGNAFWSTAINATNSVTTIATAKLAHDSDTDKDHAYKLADMLRETEYHPYLMKVLKNLGDSYATVTAPTQLIAPHVGTGGGQDTQYPSFPGGGDYQPTATAGSPYGNSPYNGSSLPSTGTAGLDPTGYDPSAYNPGAYDPGAYNPGAYDPTAGSGYDPYGSLAGAGLAGGGSGLSTPGADSGLGGEGAGRGLGAGGLAGDGAGLAGSAGRAGLPMSPGMGAGGGKESKERQRQSWLPEEDDIWGAETDAPGPVL